MRDELTVHAQRAGGPPTVRRLDFRSLFRLEADDLRRVADVTGYDLHERHGDGRVSLLTVVDELSAALAASGSQPASEAVAGAGVGAGAGAGGGTGVGAQGLPQVVRRWHELLRVARVTPADSR